MRNRFLVQQPLIDAKIPAPRGWMASDAADLAGVLEQCGPLVVKPYDVGEINGSAVVRTRDELPGGMRGPVFAQELVPGSTADIKLYGIGSRVFAIRRRFPARTLAEKLGHAILPSRDMIAIAERCREAFGLELYGIDLLESSRGPVVVGVNSTPGYKGVAGAAELIAELICEHVEHVWTEPLRNAR